MSIQILTSQASPFAIQNELVLLQQRVFAEESTGLASILFQNLGLAAVGISSSSFLYSVIHNEQIDAIETYMILAVASCSLGLSWCFRDRYRPGPVPFSFSGEPAQLLLSNEAIPINSRLEARVSHNVPEGCSLVLYYKQNRPIRYFRMQTTRLKVQRFVRSAALFVIGFSIMYTKKVPHPVSDNGELFEALINFSLFWTSVLSIYQTFYRDRKEELKAVDFGPIVNDRV